MKRCCKCGLEKPVGDFHTRGKTRPGDLQSHCKECGRALNRSYYKTNPDKYQSRRRTRYAAEPDYKLVVLMRNRVREAILGNVKTSPTLNLLAMELPEFRIYIQGQFSPGMTWENYGQVWHLDHVIPCARFDLSDPEQQKICFHWSNYQPLFVLDNLRKGARLENVARLASG